MSCLSTKLRILLSAAVILAAVAIPAASQETYDLGVAAKTQDIQSDNTDAVHLVWVNVGVLYYGRIVNNALTGITAIDRGADTIYWRPYFSVRPDGGSVNVAWTTSGMGNSLKHSWRDGSGWHTETLMTVPTTQWLCQATCAADLSGIVHVMYVIWDKAAAWSAVYYCRRRADGTWESPQFFAPKVPEYKHPMLFVDSQGRVHATWNLIGRYGNESFEAYYCSTASGGTLMGATRYTIPKGPNNDVNGYGDVYADHNGVVHRSIGGYSSALKQMCIDHSSKTPGGQFSMTTHASVNFFTVTAGDPVPAVVAGEDGRVIVAWGYYAPDGSKTVKASYFDPRTRGWSVYTVDPAADIPSNPNSYRVALTRTSTNVYGVWRSGNGHLKLFVLPIEGGPSLRLTSPNGGESWEAGSAHNITWDQNDLSGNVTIELRKGGSKLADLGTPAASAQTFSWTIPRDTVAGSDYRIRIYQGSTEDSSDNNFTISEFPVPRIRLSSSQLSFGAVASGVKTQDQQVILDNTGTGTLNWTATPSDAWITVSPASGAGDTLLTINVNCDGVGAGTYNGTITVTDPEAANSPQTIAVKLTVQNVTTAPFGAFLTPASGSVISGAISFSGWALDDIEVTKVEILRERVRTDRSTVVGADGLVYLGDAAFVAGARPDIESAYQGYPNNQRAGWGYMMQAYRLPNKGTGKFVFHARAYDRENNRTEIGVITVNGRNRTNKKPFGLIDAPAWGGTASGSSYSNRAWMLTPPPKIILQKGTTISVWIDGVMVGYPVYNQYRADVFAAYPGYRNRRGAGGTYALDTTRYSNGLHTIVWTAVDSGRASGNTGTNYFRILNVSQGGSGQAESLSLSSSAGLQSSGQYRRSSELAFLPQDYKSPVYIRTGFSSEKRCEALFPNDQGLREVRIEELDRVEIQLGEAGSKAPAAQSSLGSAVRTENFEGYLIVGDELRPLPVGSTLDAKNGVFSWQLGPGFVGSYNFVFVKHDSRGFSEKRLITVKIAPLSDKDTEE